MGAAPAPDREAPRGRAARALRRAASLPIVVYQRAISPGLPRRCRYEPTCSRYAVLAIREYGILRGLVLAAWRLVRCNPWSPGGYDPVGAQRMFKASPPAHVRR
ncbi:MAG: membrane protein insertion efficiency factor YidD [Solirubrobacterales bacterium]